MLFLFLSLIFFNFFQLFGLFLASTGWKTVQNSFMHDIFCVVLDYQLKLSKNRLRHKRHEDRGIIGLE